MSPPAGRSSKSKKRALEARDAGLRRIALATRVFVAGSIAATGAFAALAAWAQPGRSKGGIPTGSGQVAAAGSSASPNVTGSEGSGSDDGENLAPPTTMPVPSYQYTSPAIVSGAS